MRKPIIALLASATLAAGLAPATASASVAGHLAGAVAGVVLSTAITRKKQDKLAECTLYDRDGRPVTVSCPADVAAAAQNAGAGAPAVQAVPPPEPVHSAPLPALAGGPPHAMSPSFAPPTVAYLSGGLPEARCISCEPVEPPPPPVHYARPDPCCIKSAPRYERRDASVYRGRSVASYLSESSGYTEVIRHPPRVVAVYDAYGHSEERVSGYYQSSGRYSSYGDAYGIGGYPGYGFQGGVENYGGAYGYGYSYGGVGYGLGGGHAPGPVYRQNVAGRDPQGFLTWPGKR